MADQEPHWLEVVYWISQTLLFVVAAIGACVAIWQLRAIRKSNDLQLEQAQAQLAQAKATFLFDLDQMWESPTFVRSRVSFETLWNEVVRRIDENYKHRDSNGKKHAQTEEFSIILFELKNSNMREYTSVMRLCGFFETAGMLVEKGYVSISDINGLYGGTIKRLNDSFAAHISKRAEEFPPGYLEYFIKLSKDIQAEISEPKR